MEGILLFSIQPLYLIMERHLAWGEFREVVVHLHFRSTNPYAVIFSFQAADGQEGCIEWAVGRDLLAQGLVEPSGVGDVHIRPSNRRGYLVICLRGHSHEVELETRILPLRRWLAATYRLVPRGSEHTFVDWDLELHHLMGR